MGDDSDTRKLKFKVYVRLRPASESANGPNGVCKTEHRIITVHDPSKDHSSEFVFDRVFAAGAPQEDVFDEVGKPLVEHAMQGYNACCFAYGQTSSGKTFTMFGKETGEPELRGIIPRAIEHLFKVGAEVAAGSPVRYVFFVSFLEIYLEQVRDLGRAALMSQQNGGRVPRKDLEEWAKSNMDVMEDAQGQTSVKDLKYIEVSSAAEVMSILEHGAALRTTASTALNDTSSRSHTVFTISVVQYRDGNKPVTGRLHLVDLAGSERQSRTQSEGQRLTEAKAINKSLTALGKVVMALSQEGERGHIPFRDCKLTRILKDSLQGNSLTYMMANLNPLPDNAEECFNTLQFAVRCQTIDLAPRVNVVGGPGAGGAVGGFSGGEGGDYESLLAQIAALQEELEYTHAHYQKIIEQVAGPGWTANMGPLERSSITDGSIGASAGMLGAGRQGVAPPEGGAGGLVSAESVAPRGQSFGRPQTAGADSKTKRLEMQLESSRTAQKETEDQLLRKRLEYDELRDRTALKERTQFSEIRKLRTQVQELQAKLTEQDAAAQLKAEEASKRLEQESARFARDTELLRGQLAQLQASIATSLTQRSQRTAADGKARDQAKTEADREALQKIAAVTAEKERQVDNIREQHASLLKAKTDECNRLSSELSSLQRQTTNEITALKAECDYLAAYGEKVTAIVAKVEAGVVPTTMMRSGLRSFKIPARDRPAGLDSARLGYLKTSGQRAERFLQLVSTISSTDGLGSTHGSGSGGSGGNSSLGSTQQFGDSMGMSCSTPRGATRPETAGAAGGSKTAWSAQGSQQQQQQQGDVPMASPRGWDLGDDLTESRDRVHAEASHEIPPSVQAHIHSLEQDVSRYRTELQHERRRHQDMLVTLRSTQRATGWGASPLNAVMQKPVLSEPQKWGHGHTKAPYGGSNGSIVRPMTASGRLNGVGTMGGSGSFSQWVKPPTATSMQTLAAAFEQHGVPYNM